MNFPLIGTFCLLGMVGLMAGHSWSLWQRRRLLLLDPLMAFWGGIFIIYIRQPVSYSQIFIGWHDEAIFSATLAWTLAALAAVVVGYESQVGVRLGHKLPQAPAHLSPRKLSYAGYVFVGVGMAGYLYLFASAGGIDEWLSVPRGGTDYDNISSYIAQMTDLVPLGVILLVFQVHFHPTSLPRKIVIWMAAAAVWWWFLYLGSRSKLIAFTVLALGAVFLPRGKSPPLILSALVFLALFIVGNFQEHYRDKFNDLSLNLDQIDLQEARETVLPSFLGGDPAAQNALVAPGIEFNCVMSVIELVPDKVPYNYGYGHLELFTRWIPHAFWPDKTYPQMESVQGVLREGQLSDATVHDTSILMGPAFTFVGHWYYVGGPVALIIGGLLTGMMFRLIRSIYDRAPLSEGGILLYVSLIGIGFSEAVSTPLGWVSTLPFVVVPLLLVMHVCRSDIATPQTRWQDTSLPSGTLQTGGA